MVPSTVLRERLMTRGRERPEDIDQRIARAEAFEVSGADVTTIVNDGPLSLAVSRMIETLGPRSATGT